MCIYIYIYIWIPARRPRDKATTVAARGSSAGQAH